MRIQELFLTNYNVLKDFTIQFEERNTYDAPDTNYKLDLIVGVNGTGKTTLLRALAILFQIFRSGTPVPDFGFRIKYRIHEGEENQADVFISNLNEEEEPLESGILHIQVKEGDKEILDTVSGSIDERFLPPLIVAFTSGNEVGWELITQRGVNKGETEGSDLSDANLIETLQDWYRREMPGTPIEEPEQPLAASGGSDYFLFIKQRYLALVILFGFLTDMHEALEQTKNAENSAKEKTWHILQKAVDESSIKALRGFSLKFRMYRDAIDIETLHFIRELERIATHTVQTGSDYLLIFELPSLAEYQEKQQRQDQRKAESHPLEQLSQVRGNELQLFRTLLSLLDPGGDEEPLLREVNLFLERDYTQLQSGRRQEERGSEPEEREPLHLLNWLSDGEVSFLGRLCLLSLLRKSEALILLDEPEVHFNDYWKRQLVQHIDQALQQQYSHVIMTTHSSITLSDVYNKDILVLKRTDGVTRGTTTPGIRTLGTDPSDIMVYVFGAPTAAGAQSIEYIQNKIRAASEKKNEDAIKELKELEKQVGPSVWRFLIRRKLHALESVER